jgi:hypothetical protein
MSKRLSGINPLAYLGVEPITPPGLYQNGRAPTINDSTGYNLGDLWLQVPPGYSGPEALFVLISLNMGQATWVQLYPSSGGSIEFETDSGSVNPVAGVVNVFGDGSLISTTGSGNSIVIHLDDIVASNYVTDSGVAIPSGNILNVRGGANIHTSGASDTVTISLDNDVDIPGDLTVEGDTNLDGEVTISGFTEGVVQSDNSGVLSSSKGTNGQILIGSTAGAPAWANITSTGGTVTITNNANSINLEAEGGGGGTSCAFFLYQPSAVQVPNSGSAFYQGLGAARALTTKFDAGSNVTNGDGAGTPAIFTAPIGGKYYLNMSVVYSNTPSSSSNYLQTRISTTGGDYNYIPATYTSAFSDFQHTNTFSICADMNTGDTATFEIQIPTSTPGYTLGGSGSPFTTWISGFLIGSGGSGGSGNTIISRFTSSGTWTMNVATQYVEAYVVSGGGGGAGGGTNIGGGGGGSWGTLFLQGPANCFGPSMPVTVGLGGAGGAPNSVGSDGAASYLGNMSTVIADSHTSLRNGGGNLSFVETTSYPGYYGDTATNFGPYFQGSSIYEGTQFRNIGNGGASNNGFNGLSGIGAGFQSLLSPSTRAITRNYLAAGTGGGGAGSNSSARNTEYSGGSGGQIQTFNTTILVPAGTPGIESGTIDGGDGNDGFVGSSGTLTLGSGGGGGGNRATGSVAGNGGNGGFPGGGGGGGGAGGGFGPGGSGGDGANGIVVIIEYL